MAFEKQGKDAKVAVIRYGGHVAADRGRRSGRTDRRHDAGQRGTRGDARGRLNLSFEPRDGTHYDDPIDSPAGAERAPAVRALSADDARTAIPAADAEALAAELKHADRRRGAVRQGHPRHVLDRRLQLPPGADRRGHPATHRRRGGDGRAGPPARRADPLARRRHQPGRAVLQRRRRHGLLQVHAPRAGDRPGPAARAGRAGLRAGRPPRHGQATARPDVRPRPRDPQPLHARRHARQQLLRRPLADVQEQRHGPARAATTRTSWKSSPTRATASASAPTPPDELERIIRAGGPQGEIYAKLKRPPRQATPTPSARSYPKLERRVSGYNLPDLLPENGFNVARSLVGSESTLRHHPRSDRPARPRTQGAVAAGLRLPGHLHRRRARDGDPRVQADRAGGDGPPALQVRQGQGGRERQPRPAAARAAGSCWWSSAATPRTTPTTRRGGCMDAIGKQQATRRR